ncbi:MAG: FitA-like ribbon-helix-helix domain-containing protein [Dethiobacteria bacterium]
MPDLLIRDVPQEIIDELKSRAASQRRSLQQELRLILEETVKPDLLKAIRLAEEIRNKLTASGRTFSDSTTLLREDRYQ